MQVFVISAVRAVVEMLGLCLIGQGILYLLAGSRRRQNAIYRFFDLLTRPPRQVVAFLLPWIGGKTGLVSNFTFLQISLMIVYAIAVLGLNLLTGFNDRWTAWLPALIEHHCGVGERGGFLQRRYTALVAAGGRRAAAVLTVSRASARDIVDHLRISPERVHVGYYLSLIHISEPTRPY